MIERNLEGIPHVIANHCGRAAERADEANFH
jgi:hypothetical protein